MTLPLDLRLLCDAMENTKTGFVVLGPVWEGDEIVDSVILYRNNTLAERYGHENVIGWHYHESFPSAVDTFAAHMAALRRGESWAGRISYRDLKMSGYFDVEIVPYGKDHEYALSWSREISDEVAAMQTALDSAQLVMETMEALFKNGSLPK